MLLKKFVNRVEELKFLEERYNSHNPEFIIIYGRRRIDKTEMSKRFINGKKILFVLLASALKSKLPKKKMCYSSLSKA